MPWKQNRPFSAPSGLETPEAVDRLCRAYEEAVGKGELDPLLLIPMFILDFLCIHPFNDGNGRMSRLLTLLLLYRAGYIVGKYISIEKLIERAGDKETYDETLQRVLRAGTREATITPPLRAIPWCRGGGLSGLFRPGTGSGRQRHEQAGPHPGNH